MVREDAWTATWASKKLLSHTDINSVSVCGPNQIALSVSGIERDVRVATLSVRVVSGDDVRDVCHSNDVEFVLNVHADAVIDHAALSSAARIPAGIGGVRDLYVAAADREFRNYICKEASFILRALRQHLAVFNVARESNRTYRVQRAGQSDVLVLALNNYDITAETVRDGIERFGRCNFILASHPHSRASQESIEAAQTAGSRLVTLKQLLGALNH